MRLNNYNDITEYLKAGRNPNHRKICNNTWAERKDENTVVIRLHQTDILTFTPTLCTLNTGGWQTVTTKDRLNKHLPPPFRIYQTNRMWFWHTFHDGQCLQPAPYTDGDYLQLLNDGQWSLHANTDMDEVMKRKQLLNKIRKYAKLCADAVPLELPSRGDCWFCHFMVNDRNVGKPVTDRYHDGVKTLGEAAKDDHILSHMSEPYVVPSLVFRALQQAHVGPLIYEWVFKRDGHDWQESYRDMARDTVSRAVRRYVASQLGLAR